MPVNLAYNYDPDSNLWSSAEPRAFSYSDGDEIEARIFEIVSNASDRSSISQELESKAFDWASRYHLSRARANLLRPLHELLKDGVLELGELKDEKHKRAFPRFDADGDGKVTPEELENGLNKLRR